VGANKWRIFVDCGLDANGKRRRRTEVFQDSKRDAEKRLRELLTQAELGGLDAERKMTVAEFLEKWLADYVTGLAPMTQTGYRRLVTNQISPYWEPRNWRSSPLSVFNDGSLSCETRHGETGSPASCRRRP
jgi:hypothetical protein